MSRAYFFICIVLLVYTLSVFSSGCEYKEPEISCQPKCPLTNIDVTFVPMPSCPLNGKQPNNTTSPVLGILERTYGNDITVLKPGGGGKSPSPPLYQRENPNDPNSRFVRIEGCPCCEQGNDCDSLPQGQIKICLPTENGTISLGGINSVVV